MTTKQSVDLFREASALLGDDAGIESDPYEMPSHQGIQPTDDKADYNEWANNVLGWHRFKPGTADRTVWRLHARGASSREIGGALGFSFTYVAKRIRILTDEVKAADKRRQHGLNVTIKQCSPRVLIQLLKASNV